MKKTSLLITAAVAISLLAACGPTTFLLGKNGEYAFFGRRNTDLGKELCRSGEMRAILDDAGIPSIARDGFYRYICTQEYNWETVQSIYAFMTPEEKRELMRAFARRGYDVNLVSC